jgi:UDP-glucose:(heptosyl)LPS alpha-1,3-glucosyltransferase
VPTEDAPTLSVAIVRARYNPYGGAERFVQRALAALSANDVEVTVIARSWPDRAADSLPVKLHYLRVDPFYIGSVWRDWSFARGVRRVLDGRGFAVVQSHERIAGLPIYRAGDGVHAEYLAQRRRAAAGWRAALLGANPYHAYVLATERAMFTHPGLRAVICNSEMVRGEIRERFGVDASRLHLIRNGVDTRRFRPPSPDERARARTSLGVAEGARAFAFVGSGFERKGLRTAIRALASVARGTDACLLVAGTDRHAGAYRALARALGVADRVRLLGGVDEVTPLLWAADAFVLPTLYDPFPNAALEALACGLPVATSTKCGAAELIRPGVNGFVHDSLDSQGFAESMALLCDDSRRARMAAAARDSVEGLSLEALAAQLIALYRGLLESASP